MTAAILLASFLAGVLVGRELLLYRAHQRDQALLAADREVAELESVFDREWGES